MTRWLSWLFPRLLLSLLLGLSTPAWSSDEIYQGLGQQGGIGRLVGRLMPLMLDDARLGKSLQDPGLDLDHLRSMLAEQFCAVSGGPCKYTGKDMVTIHDGLGITAAQFYALVEDLQLAMEREGIAARIQNKLLARLAPMYRDMVTR